MACDLQSGCIAHQTKYRNLVFLTLAAIWLAGCGGRGSPTIKARPQALVFGAAPILVLHGNATVTATASSGLPVNYSSTTPAVCMVDSQTGIVTDLGAGTCTIAADQPGNEEYAPATQVTLDLSAVPDPVQTLGFATAPALTLYGTATVSATASSGLAVSYSSITPSVCTVDSHTGIVTDLAVGTCTIAADQPGDIYYNAAPQATQSFTVPAWAGTVTPPGVPEAVTATLGSTPDTVIVSFTGPASSGGSPIGSYTVTSSPVGISTTGSTSPISVPCTTPCAGYSFSVVASNGIGNSSPSAPADVITRYNVTATFFEPDTQPNNSIFSGSFAFNSTTGSVSGLQGTLTQSMTHINDGIPMNTVALDYQLSSVSDGAGGLLVTTFALNTTHTFSEGGFAPGSPGLYYGFPSATNPAQGGSGNAYATIYVNLSNPIAALTPAQLGKLAYADCTALGMMGDVCMTGYVGFGTMSGFPLSQLITRP